MNVTLSIVTICYNNEKGLRRTFESLKPALDSMDCEWLIIDGNSSDGTKMFLHELQQQHYTASIKILSESDHGIYDAMNKGIHYATGQYLWFLNAGDLLTNAKTYRKIIERLQQNPDFLYGDAFEGDPHTDYHKPARPIHDMIRGMFTHHQAMIYRRDLMADLRYDLSYQIAADYDFTIAYLKRVKSLNIAYLPEPICWFEQGGLSSQNADQGRQEMHRIRQIHFNVPWWDGVILGIKQQLTLTLKRLAPQLYWKIRKLRF